MRFGFHKSLFIGSLALLSACSATSPVPPQLPFALPDTFHEGFDSLAGTDTDGRSGNSWWTHFSDEHLNQLVDTALVRNPAQAQALARSRVAEARVRLTRADQLPQIGAGFGSIRQRQNLGVMMGPLGDLAGNGASISNQHNLSLDVSWELDLWGRLSALTAAARADYLASAEQLRGARQSLTAQVAQLYFNIVHARAQVELSERTVAAMHEMSRQVGNRVAVGIASPADGMLADANLGSAEAGLEQRREALERSLRQLEVMLGSYPAGSLQTAASLPVLSAPPVTGIPAQLLERRPDVRAAELALLGAGYQLEAAERSFLPSLSLTGSAGYSGNDFSELLNSRNLIWSIAGRMLQPVFQGGRLVAQVDMIEGQRDEALHAYAETALNALAEVESILAIESLLQRREQSLDAAASAAEEAVRVSLNRYLQGIDPFLNVLESQQRALDGRSAHISARYARLENRIALYLALGGGFENAALGANPVDRIRNPSQP